MSRCEPCCAVLNRRLLLVRLLVIASLLVPLLNENEALAKPDETKPAVEVLAGVLYLPDLLFGKADGVGELRLDLAMPAKGKGPFPAVVVLPGGGWTFCERKDSVPLIQKLAQEGYVAVSVTYRTIKEVAFPGPLHDAKCAVRWLRANARKYAIDPDRIGALGYSAGGHLACMLGTINAKELEGDGGHAEYSSRVQAVVSFYGILDLGQLHDDFRSGRLSMVEGYVVSSAMRGLVRGPNSTWEARLQKASPIHHVSKSTSPTLLLHGTKDTLVPIRQSERYEEKLKEVEVTVRLVKLTGAPHNFGGKYETQAQKEVLLFLRQHLRQSQQVVGVR